MTLLTIAACIAFVQLGSWQWHKGQRRQEEYTRFARGEGQVIELGGRPLSGVPRFQRVRLSGRWDSAHQFLLDNRTHDGQAGYEVLTPLQRADGTVLVDRGWVPFTGRRTQLPDISLRTAGAVTLTGRTDELPAPGLESGRAPPSPDGGWPKLTSYPSMPQLAQALQQPLEPRILLLDADQPEGYVRAWQPPGMSPLRHWSYAIQWWAFAALAVALWVIMSFKREAENG